MGLRPFNHTVKNARDIIHLQCRVEYLEEALSRLMKDVNHHRIALRTQLKQQKIHGMAVDSRLWIEEDLKELENKESSNGI